MVAEAEARASSPSASRQPGRERVAGEPEGVAPSGPPRQPQAQPCSRRHPAAQAGRARPSPPAGWGPEDQGPP
eukprot:1396012-Alexandrium_andersonii.AAC.1